MVHLASVPNDEKAQAPLVEGMADLKLEPNAEEDEVTASVYGSRFAAECLPMHEMPEKEMPKEIAYRMIKDDLSLDGNPMLNLASFVTTYMVLPLAFSHASERPVLTHLVPRRKRKPRSSWQRHCQKISSITKSILRRQKFKIDAST